MKNLAGYKEEIHSCSKCGLCQSVCPVYKITGNDCTVSRGHFIMLKGLIKGKLKMTKKMNYYLDLCLKCGSCSKFCPGGIDVVQIIAAAKAEYYKSHPLEHFISFIQKNLIFNTGVRIGGIFSRKIKSKKFDRKVIFFGGCSGEISGNHAVVKLLNACNIEVISPKFDCCGIPFYVRGDSSSYEEYKRSFIKKIEEYDIKDVVTTCASCEKTLKDYNIENLNIKNIFEYIKENCLHLSLKKPVKATFHKPCNLDNYGSIKWILNNTKNLEYIEMDGYDSCCGFNGIFKPDVYKIIYKILKSKRECIIKTGADIVLTSCPGCKTALSIPAFLKYRVLDLTEFLAKNAEISNQMS